MLIILSLPLLLVLIWALSEVFNYLNRGNNDEGKDTEEEE